MEPWVRAQAVQPGVYFQQRQPPAAVLIGLLQDISNIQKINAVVVGGKLLPKSELQAMLAKVEAAASAAAPSQPCNLEDLLRKYNAAANRGDLETLRTMLADDVVWFLGSQRLEGKEKVLGPHTVDAACNTRLDLSNVVVKGDIVEFELVEKNDFLAAIGMAELHHFGRFTFKDCLVKQKGPARRASVGVEELQERMNQFMKWIREKHPEALPKLFESEDKFIYSDENGLLLVKLAKEWRAKT